MVAGRSEELVTLSLSEDRVVPLSGIVDPEELNILTLALQRYCDRLGIEAGTPAYFDAGARAISLFESGIVTANDIVEALCQSDKRNERRSG